MSLNSWKTKLRCLVCNHLFLFSERLEGRNPFQENETIYGCPHCFEIDMFDTLCDEPGCEKVICCGFATEDKNDEWNGYRNTCDEHG